MGTIIHTPSRALYLRVNVPMWQYVIQDNAGNITGQLCRSIDNRIGWIYIIIHMTTQHTAFKQAVERDFQCISRVFIPLTT